MGRYSTDSDDSYYSSSKRKKKSKKRRSRSRSSSEEPYVKKPKKSKKKRSSKKRSSRSRSRSRSGDRHRRRRSRTRSRSRDRRRSRSRSTSRYRSSRRSRTRSKSPRSSRSRRYSRSRSRSPDRYKRSESPPKIKEIKLEEPKEEPKEDPCLSIPGFEKMSFLQQNDLRMQLALKAAAATDERLRKEGVLAANVGRAALSVEEQMKRSQNITQIEGEAFVQQTFTSNRSERPLASVSETSTSSATHENAIFSHLPLNMDPPKKLKTRYTDPDSMMGPLLYENQDERMDRWIKKLTLLQKKKLEGETIS